MKHIESEQLWERIFIVVVACFLFMVVVMGIMAFTHKTEPVEEKYEPTKVIRAVEPMTGEKEILPLPEIITETATEPETEAETKSVEEDGFVDYALPKTETETNPMVETSSSYEEISEYVKGKSEETGVPYALIMAVIEHESHFDPLAVSATNDHGLMQINAGNHSWMRKVFGNEWDVYNPYDNINAGVYMLSMLYERHGKDVSETLLCYQCGEGGAARRLASGITETTATREIMELMGKYGETT